jgi:exosortase E/protease (VPEID-CTERM system)
MNPNQRSAGNSRSLPERFCALFHPLLGRLYLFAIILALEAVLVVGCFQLQYAFHPALLPVAIVSFAVFLGLGYPWLKEQRERLPFGLILFGGFLACVAVTIFISAAANLPSANRELRWAAPYTIFAALLLEIPLLALACIPLRAWIGILRATHPLWLYALLAGAAAWVMDAPLKSLWIAPDGVHGSALQIATFDSVRMVLRWVLPGSFADSASLTIGTPRFAGTILQACSGLEGMGLILAFSLVWLWYLRKQCRFPQALLLIPCALACMWVTNIIRICALILIGDAFGPEVAMVGFHSEFGWIAFTSVALVFCLATDKLSWVRKAPSPADAPEQEGKYRGESPLIRAYLVPFLVILAATFVSKAASGYFEWLYPLRFVAAAVALVCYWPQLKKLNWRVGWAAPVAGLAVFLVWIAPTWWTGHFAASPIGPALAALSPAARWSWISCRVAAAVITVPIAEELAFRGYLTRRFMRWDFDSVPLNGLTALSVCLSSAAFGLMHGRQWLVGILAGLAYALVLRWRGRIGDAVVAHAVTNLLLAAWVLGFGDWAQW